MYSKFRQNITNIYGSKGQQWLNNLPDIANKIAKEWNLSNLKPVDNLSMNYVVSGLQHSQEIILKLSLNDDLIKREYTALTALDGFGAVEVLSFKERALLLKKLSPAISLQTYLPDRRIEALKIACEVTQKLHQAPMPQSIKLPSIEERFSLLDKNWPIPQDYLILARQFKDYIFNSCHERKILHGDLHHENIMQDRDNWLVIDPHGVIGFPINEVWAFVQDIEQDIPYIANYFEFNLDDLKKCYFMHAILSSVWALEDNMDPLVWLDLVTEIKAKFEL